MSKILVTAKLRGFATSGEKTIIREHAKVAVMALRLLSVTIVFLALHSLYESEDQKR